MKRLKLTLMFLIFFFVIYVSISIIYKNIVLNDKYIDAYMLNKDIMKGEKITKDDVYKIKINKEEYKEDFNLIKNEFDENELIQINLFKGQLVTKDLFIKNSEYNFEEGKEIISLNIDKSDVSTNIKIQKGSFVNVYFINQNEIDVSKQVTLIAKNVKVIDVNDDEANSVSKSKKASKIIVSLSNDKVMLVNRYNKTGCFNISLVN